MTLGALIQAVKECRVDLLLAEPGRTSGGEETFYFTLVRCQSGRVQIDQCLRLWCEADGADFYLITDRDAYDCGAAFKINQRGFHALWLFPFRTLVSAAPGLTTGNLKGLVMATEACA